MAAPAEAPSEQPPEVPAAFAEDPHVQEGPRGWHEIPRLESGARGRGAHALDDPMAARVVTPGRVQIAHELLVPGQQRLVAHHGLEVRTSERVAIRRVAQASLALEPPPELRAWQRRQQA